MSANAERVRKHRNMARVALEAKERQLTPVEESVEGRPVVFLDEEENVWLWSPITGWLMVAVHKRPWELG